MALPPLAMYQYQKVVWRPHQTTFFWPEKDTPQKKFPDHIIFPQRLSRWRCGQKPHFSRKFFSKNVVPCGLQTTLDHIFWPSRVSRWPCGQRPHFKDPLPLNLPVPSPSPNVVPCALETTSDHIFWLFERVSRWPCGQRPHF